MKKLLLGILVVFLLSLMPVSASQHTCVSGPAGNLGMGVISAPISFAPGETLNIQASVTNSDPINTVTGVVLQAALMNDNTGNEVVRATSSQQNVPNSGSSTFNVNLVVPSTNVPKTNTYTLYLKAYKVGSESSQCAQDNDSITSRSDLVVTSTNPSNGDPLQSVIGKVTVSSSLSTIPTVNILAKNFVSGSNTIPASAVTLGTTSLTNVQSGSPQNVDVTINIPASQSPGLYVGSVEVSDGADTKTAQLQFSVNSKSQFDVVESLIIVSGDEDSTRTRQFSIRNTGNNLLSNFNFAFTQSDFSDSGKNIQISFSDPGSLSTGETKLVTMTIDIPGGVDEKDYTGTITVTSSSVSDTFTLTVRVLPELCEEGETGSKLSITEVDIDEEELELGDTLMADIEVSNDDDDDDVKVKIKAILWNNNEKTQVGDDFEATEKIDEDDNHVFKVEIEVPEFEEDDIGDDDEYWLLVKAFESGDEDEQCIEHIETGIEIERKDEDVRIKGATAVPSIVSCGSDIDFSITAQNVGIEDDDSVYVRLVLAELGFDDRSSSFELGEFNDNDNDHIDILSFTVPDDTEEKLYSATARVVFDNGREEDEELVLFTVSGNCGDGTATTTGDDDGTTGGAIVTTGTTNGDGSTEDSRSRTVEFKPVSAFDSIDSKTVFWIIGDIVLVLIAILFIKLIFTQTRPKI